MSAWIIDDDTIKIFDVARQFKCLILLSELIRMTQDHTQIKVIKVCYSKPIGMFKTRNLNV